MNAENIVIHFLSFIAWVSMAFFLAGYRRTYLDLKESLNSLRLTGSFKRMGKPSQVLKSIAKNLGITVTERTPLPREVDRLLELAPLVNFLFSLKCDKLEVEFDINDHKISLLMPSNWASSQSSVELNDPNFKVKVSV